MAGLFNFPDKQLSIFSSYGDMIRKIYAPRIIADMNSFDPGLMREKNGL